MNKKCLLSLIQEGWEKTSQETTALVAVLSLDVDSVSNEHSNH